METRKPPAESRAFVLLSGGLDSSTLLAMVVHDHQRDQIEGVSIDYGQRHKKEMRYALIQTQTWGVDHAVITLPPSIMEGAMLTDHEIAIPDVTYDQIKGVSPTYVPFRNGLMLSLLTARAQRWIDAANKRWNEAGGRAVSMTPKPEAFVYFGAHAEDAQNWAYPDCTPEFIGAMTNAIYIGTYQQVRLMAPLMHASKAGIVRTGTTLGVNFANTWSCYAGEDAHCGRCPTCYARQKAFAEAGVSDPTVYVHTRK